MEIILGIIILGLLATITAAAFVIRNLLIQNATYENWVVTISGKVDSTYEKMVEMDDRQMFQSDDEVGVIFTDIRQVLEDLHDKLGDPDGEKSDEEETNS
jgi:hypothetical protein